MRISDWSSDVCSSDLVRDGVDYLVVDVPSELEAAGDLRVLEVVTEAHDRRDLAGDVTVLAPSADLVVAHLRAAGREGAGLGVLVALALDAVRRGRAEVAPAVADGGGAGALAGQGLGRVGIHDELGAGGAKRASGGRP